MTDVVMVDFAVPLAEIEKFFEWTECAAFRFVRDGDEVWLEFTNDLDGITRPEETS